jgi:hypothetical protein
MYDLSYDNWYRHVQYLADPKMNGRETGSIGYNKAADYVKSQMNQIGLVTRLQPIKFRARTLNETTTKVTLNGKELEFGNEFILNIRRNDPLDSTITADIVFVGYGLFEHEFTNIDVKNKFIMYLNGGPANINSDKLAIMRLMSSRWKLFKNKHIKGIIVLDNPNGRDIPWSRSHDTRHGCSMDIIGLSKDLPDGIPILVANEKYITKWISNKQYKEIMHIDRKNRSMGTAATMPKFNLNCQLSVSLKLNRWNATSNNVIGSIKGKSQKQLVISAHLDHIGKNHNGMLDNAVGVASLLEIAKNTKLILNHYKFIPKYTIVFLACTAEEKGLLGSKFYTSKYKSKIIGNLNMDMYMPLIPLRMLSIEGMKQSPKLMKYIKHVANKHKLKIEGIGQDSRGTFVRSDQYSFISKGIEGVAIGFGYHKGREESILKKWLKTKYHGINDKLGQRINHNGVIDYNLYITDLILNIVK